MFASRRQYLITIMLFGFGAIFAIADPAHPVPSEDNWIRYWTSGVLVIAGLTAVVSGLKNIFPIQDRILGSAFGLLLIAAAGDELFQFHERSGELIAHGAFLNLPIDGQDLVTFLPSVVGFAVMVLIILFTRMLPQTKYLYQESKYRQSILLVFLGGSSFLVAMTLDSFDWVLEDLFDPVRIMLLGDVQNEDIPHWIGRRNLSQAANGLEELLEHLAAVLFLMGIGTLFSIRLLGCNLQDYIKER